jgi:hypothetical protein
MKKIILIPICLILFACAELQSIAETVLEDPGVVTDSQISSGLKQALQFGIDHQVSKLTAEDGFFTNELVKIVLPEELRKVDDALRKIGLGNLADEGLKLMNSAASDAVKEATPIFVNAIKDMSITDARDILLGGEGAATQFLQNKTSDQLFQKFYPVVDNSFGKVGADQIWTTAIDKYNTLPFTKEVNNNLTEYVAQQALQGVFTMIAVEEAEIRTNLQSRTTDLLQKVFKLQDNR